MIRKADAIRYEADVRGADEADIGLVGAHLAGRRRERRMLLVCSVLAVLGVLSIGAAYTQSLSLSTGFAWRPEGVPPRGPRR